MPPLNAFRLNFSFLFLDILSQGEDQIVASEYRFLLSGISPSHIDAPMPATNWLESNVWSDICDAGGLRSLRQFPDSIKASLSEWKAVFDSTEPHRLTFPSPYSVNISPMQRLCVLRCLRRDKMELAIQDFIVEFLGNQFIQPPPFDLRACYNDSTPITPLIFVLSSGSDPNKELDILADEMNMSQRLKRIALGQGQGKKASALIEKGMEKGDWCVSFFPFFLSFFLTTTSSYRLVLYFHPAVAYPRDSGLLRNRQSKFKIMVLRLHQM
jgi:dynein heavy chain